MGASARRQYSMLVVNLSAAGANDVCAVSASQQAMVHRLTIANTGGTNRVVALKPNGGSVTLTVAVLAGDTQDLDELYWSDANKGTKPVLTIDGADANVKCRVEYSLQSA